LRLLLAIVDGTETDERVSRGQAALQVIERIYGKAPKAPEDQDRESAMNVLLARLVGGHDERGTE
jgi:hypothetical protein